MRSARRLSKKIVGARLPHMRKKKPVAKKASRTKARRAKATRRKKPNPRKKRIASKAPSTGSSAQIHQGVAASPDTAVASASETSDEIQDAEYGGES